MYHWFKGSSPCSLCISRTLRQNTRSRACCAILKVKNRFLNLNLSDACSVIYIWHNKNIGTSQLGVGFQGSFEFNLVLFCYRIAFFTVKKFIWGGAFEPVTPINTPMLWNHHHHCSLSLFSISSTLQVREVEQVVQSSSFKTVYIAFNIRVRFGCL